MPLPGFPLKHASVVYENLPDLNAKIIFMTNTGSNTRAAIFPQITDQEIKRFIGENASR